MSDELVVTDADREAAAEYWAQSSAIPCGENHDQPDGSLLAQAFARHRTKALASIQTSLPDEVKAMVEKMGAALEEVQDRDRPLPWVVHTGSSYRRIASEPTPENGYRGFPDGNVLHGVVDRHDGHHDLSMGEDQLTGLVEIVNATPTLLAMLTCLSARIAELEAQIARDKAEWVEIPRMTMGKQADG